MSEQKKYETRELSGSAFRNKRKQKDSHPDYTGEVRINGQLYWFNVWEKRTQAGEPWFSASFNVKEERAPEQTRAAPQPQQEANVDPDSIPF